ncbi:hypothetical protein HMPREF0168_1042 [Bifidobacterium dentium ATCC 27679]|uniref:Uncharacterized protein n=1 Tax=Bifidobacterium dentium ATCC 27679 TaxID=871562 RepID=E0Q7D4_9BIFI|nr:hypothetical protein HMPREF0168_1042 [Bifidobacterium dentium ATCC 27679]
MACIVAINNEPHERKRDKMLEQSITDYLTAHNLVKAAWWQG